MLDVLNSSVKVQPMKQESLGAMFLGDEISDFEPKKFIENS